MIKDLENPLALIRSGEKNGVKAVEMEILVGISSHPRAAIINHLALGRMRPAETIALFSAGDSTWIDIPTEQQLDPTIERYPFNQANKLAQQILPALLNQMSEWAQ